MFQKENNLTKGFTLLELIIVIGIIAILASVTVVVLNPAQLLAESRDVTRVSDLAAIQSALGLYVASASSPDMDGPGAASCAASCFVGVAGTGINCGGRHVGATKEDVVTRVVDGNGWLPVNLGSLSSGSPLAVLPIDPSNGVTYFYSYACNNTVKTFELNANLESTRYATGGNDDKESNTKDGGTVGTIYEIGTEPGLDI